MRIGICPVLGRYSGPRTYSLNIIKHIAAIDEENEFFVYSEEQFLGPGENFRTCKLTVPSAILRIVPDMPVFVIQQHLLRDKIDVFFSHRAVLPIFKIRAKHVVTIYDVAWELFPSWCSLKGYAYLKSFVRRAAKGADAIITISQAAKDEIVRVYDIQEDKVHVVYMAAGEDFRTIDKGYASQRVRDRYNISDGFILYAGAVSERKNTIRLLQAYKILKERYGRRENLVIVTSYIDRSTHFKEKIRELGIQEKVVLLPNVVAGEMPALYNAAKVFTYPSLYDGFSLPVLEAMSCGTPVVCSSTPAFREEVGSAALVFDPYDPEPLAYCINQVLTETGLSDDLAKKGLQRAASFNWLKSARQTLGVLYAFK